LLAGLASADPELVGALELLAGWDGVEDVDSASAAIAEVWMNKHLAPAIARRIGGEATAKVIGYGSPFGATRYLETLGPGLGADPEAARTEILLTSLRAALDEIAAKLGPDMARWRWGDLHHASLVPAAATLADEPLQRRLSHGPTPLPGSAWTVWASTYRMADFAVTQGASFRMVVDVGGWDNSLVINTPGQSGEVDSPHYGDLFPLWARGEYVPLLWSRGAVEAAAERVFALSPA
jgi:penicillin G amidase